MKKIFLISGLVLIIDLVTKLIITSNIELNTSIVIIKNFFSLTYVRNTGAAFSALSNNTLFLAAISIVILGILISTLKNKKDYKKLEIIAFGFIIGGAVGNLINRIFNSYVVDFLDFRIFGHDFAIFNLADTFIVIGGIIYLIHCLGSEKNEENNSNGNRENRHISSKRVRRNKKQNSEAN